MNRRSFIAGALATAALPMPLAAAVPDRAAAFFQQHLGDLPAELRDARKAGKRGVLLIYEMDGCPFCEWLHREALQVPAVQDYYRKHFVSLRIDVKGASQIVGFDGKERTEAEFAKSQKVAGTPTSVFYDLDGREVARFAGAPRNRREYLLLGEYVAEGHYRNGAFPAFRDSRGK